MIGQTPGSATDAACSLFLGAPIWVAGGWDLPIVVNVCHARGPSG